MKKNSKKEKWTYDFSPFSAVSPNGQFVVRIADEVKRPICMLPMPIGGINTKEKQEANAKLIAAAPELLEALIECKNALQKNLSKALFKDEKIMLSAFNKANDVIKKATE